MSTKPASAPRAQAVPGRENAGGDRRLRLDDILKLMVADGLVAHGRRRRRRARSHAALRAPAGAHRRPQAALRPVRRTPRSPSRRWSSGWPASSASPTSTSTRCASTSPPSRRRCRSRTPSAIASCRWPSSREALTVATAQPFVRSWADELERILKLRVELVFANPADIRRYLGEFFNLARSMKKAQETSKGELSLARNFEQLVELGQRGNLDANDQHVVHIVDWLWQYAFDQRASDIHVEPRRDVGHGALPHRRRAAPGLHDPDPGAQRDGLAHQDPRADGRSSRSAARRTGASRPSRRTARRSSCASRPCPRPSARSS